MPTRLWAVRDALFDLAKAHAGTGVEVFNGPLPAKSTPPKKFVLIGTDGGDDGFGSAFGDEASTIEQTESDLGGNGWRDEDGLIICAAWAWSGDTDLAPVRSTTSDIVLAIEAAVRADRTLGGVLILPGLATFTSARFQEAQTSKGALARALFTVSYRALIT